MEDFKKNYESLIKSLGDDIDLSSVLDFITYFRTDDVSLYSEFLKHYNYDNVGYYDTEKLIELYCKHNDIILSDENAGEIFRKLVNNIWNNNMSYHLTTSFSALNIYNNGMDPAKKDDEVKADIDSLIDVLSEDGKRIFFPYALKDKNVYSFSSIPNLAVNYGRKPEWYLNLTFFSQGSVEETMNLISRNLVGESDEAKERMFEVISKYHNIYNNSSRKMVVIPGLNHILSNQELDEFNVKDVDTLRKGISVFLNVRGKNIDARTDKIVSSSELMFIDVKTRALVDFEEQAKKM